jgi:hypothetical protein
VYSAREPGAAPLRNRGLEVGEGTHSNSLRDELSFREPKGKEGPILENTWRYAVTAGSVSDHGCSSGHGTTTDNVRKRSGQWSG